MSDTEEIRAVTQAIYAAISGPAGERDWPAHEKHFASGARSFVLHRREGMEELKSYTQAEYIASRAPFFRSHDFWEVETHCEVRVDGPLAVASSYYDSFWDLAKPPFESGLNTILLVKLQGEWKIASIMWEARMAAQLVAQQTST